MKLTLAVIVCLAFLWDRAEAQYLRVDPFFSVEVDGPIGGVGVQVDSRIVIGGGFMTVNGVARSKVARLNVDGSVDQSFVPVQDPSNYGGQIIVTASNIYAGTQRYDLSGNLEATYPAGEGYAIDSSRRQLWGAVTEWRVWQRLRRWNADGSQDMTFSPQIDPCCLNRGVNAVAIQNYARQEKILIGGKFGDVNGSGYPGLARLNDDGSTDTNFVGYGVESPIVVLKMWKDGQFYTATEYTVVRRHLADGSLDPGFTPFHLGGPSAADVYGIVPDNSGCVIVFGDDFSSSSRTMIRRYKIDGTEDTNFLALANWYVQDVIHQSDDAILIVGNFNEVNCIRRTYLARLIPSNTPDPLPCVPPPPPPPKPEPELTMTRLPWARMICCWPTNYPEYTLQATRRLRPRQPEKEKWVTVTNTPLLNGESLCLTNRIARWGRHYRLVKQ